MYLFSPNFCHNFLIIIGLHQFDSDISLSGFLCVYSAWYLLNVYNQLVYSFYQNWKLSSYYFSKYFTASKHPFWEYNYMYIRLFNIGPQITNFCWFCLCLYVHGFFSLCASGAISILVCQNSSCHSLPWFPSFYHDLKNATKQKLVTLFSYSQGSQSFSVCCLNFLNWYALNIVHFSGCT